MINHSFLVFYMEIFHFLINRQIPFSTNDISKFNFVKKINKNINKTRSPNYTTLALLDEGFISRKIKIIEK